MTWNPVGVECWGGGDAMLVKHGRISVWATMGYLTPVITPEITPEITTYCDFCELSADSHVW